MPKERITYQVHVILVEVGPNEQTDILEEEEVRGLKDTYTSYKEAYNDFMKIKRTK